MGKALLLFLVASSLGGVSMMSQSWSTERAADEDQIVEHAQMLAREIALSAYAIGVDRVKASFYERPITGKIAFENVQFGEGFYDLYILEMPSGAIRVTAQGRMRVPIPDPAHGTDYTERTHTVQGDFAALNDSPGTLVVDAPDPRISLSSGTEWRVIGDDVRPPNVCEAGPTAGRGIATSAMHFRQGIDPLTEALLRYHLGRTTPGGSTTITEGPIGTYFQDAYAQAVQMATNRVTPGSRVINTSETFTPGDNETLGSPTLPVAVLVNGNVRFQSNARGYGVLIVRGNLEMRGNSSWEGMVFVVKNDYAYARLTERSQILGSLFAQVTTTSLTPGRFDFRIQDYAKMLSSAEAVGALSNYIPALGAVSRVEPITERHAPATSYLSGECSGADDPPPPDEDDGGDDGENECGCREGKVGVMHYPRNGNRHIICIAPPAVVAHTISPHHWARNGEDDYVVCNP
jgi:hypothetical protein